MKHQGAEPVHCTDLHKFYSHWDPFPGPSSMTAQCSPAARMGVWHGHCWEASSKLRSVSTVNKGNVNLQSDMQILYSKAAKIQSMNRTKHDIFFLMH